MNIVGRKRVVRIASRYWYQNGKEGKQEYPEGESGICTHEKFLRQIEADHHA
jgi:hypothetical protein